MQGGKGTHQIHEYRYSSLGRKDMVSSVREEELVNKIKELRVTIKVLEATIKVLKIRLKLRDKIVRLEEKQKREAHND